MRIHLFLLGLLVTGAALAEPDTFGLGTGRSGLLRVQLPNTVINHYGQLTAVAAAGSRDLILSNAAAFTAGELVLLYQSGGLLPAPASGDQRPINLTTSSVGRFEYARVETVGAGSLRLTAPLQYSYAANAAQVLNVPEYTDVQVLSGSSLKATSWDGGVGGVLALLATGTLTNDGLVTVDGAGFRGGAFINHPSLYDCTSLDQPAGDGGSYKGEGVVAGRFGTAAGRGNLSNGGGSGNCHSAGGAGGGHSGAGGKGGYTVSSSPPATQDVGGLGGARVAYLPYEHLVLGGGGGGGAGHVDFGTSGAAGGGVMLIRAGAVTGTGRFSATGASADFVPSSFDDGAGGGGAGGAISVRTAKGLQCGLAQASGGAGGDTRHPSSESGPGGGGGGGVVFLQGESITCPVSVVAGYPGQSTAAGGTFGAGPSTIDGGSFYGVEQTYQLAYQTPATPVLIQPPNGATGLPGRPPIMGTSEPGVVIHVFLDGVPYAQVVSAGDGSFAYNPPDNLTAGMHDVQASAEVFGAYSPSSTLNRFQVGTGGDGGVMDGGSTLDGGSTQDGGVSGAQPILVVPQEGELVDPLPVFAGTSLSGVSVSIEVDGAELARVALDDQRRFHYTAEQKLAPGAHSALVRAWELAGDAGLSSRVTNFEVKPSTALDVGCGCGASPDAGLGAVVLLLGWGAARLRRRQ
jgi:hypothetical protein